MIAKLLAAGFATAIGSFAIACNVPEPIPVFQLQVITYDGQQFVAGSGDDCVAAWQGARVPEGWREIKCVEASPLQFAFHF